MTVDQPASKENPRLQTRSYEEFESTLRELDPLEQRLIMALVDAIVANRDEFDFAAFDQWWIDRIGRTLTGVRGAAAKLPDAVIEECIEWLQAVGP
jgi:hypothetical protein